MILSCKNRAVDFSFQMDLEREFFREDQFIHQEKGYVLIDPLMISLDTTTLRLSEVSALFDLEVEGDKESVFMLKPGSGFLSLDKNEDGTTNCRQESKNQGLH